MRRKKTIRRLLWTLLVLFILMNGIAFLHAYKFTHFTNADVEQTPRKLSLPQKLKLAVTGISNPRPVNKQTPASPYETIKIQSNVLLDCWWIRRDSAIGTVVVFHGYAAEKSSMLDKSEVFQALGYNTLLVDFMGSGGSEGARTTIGFDEAEEVKDCFDYLVAKGEKTIHLFGTSMGAVAIMKAVKDHSIKPASVMLECPFGTMYETVCARFRSYNVPTVPMAGLLMFWGSVQNGFWTFSHNPANYARHISCPTLLMYGEQDERVSRKEIDVIFQNLTGNKKLATYPLAGHENYLLKYKQEWSRDVTNFLFSVDADKTGRTDEQGTRTR